MEIPVYLFTGFMDSGKTSLITQTLIENDFGEGSKTLLISCEDGEIEYDKAELKTSNIEVVYLTSDKEFQKEKLNELNETCRPNQVFIEYNGTWELTVFMDTKLPRNWILVQSLATVDAQTFEVYLSNMRAMIMEQLFQADAVIFNRCDEDTPKGKFRRAVKALNRRAQIVYERVDGTIDENDMEELPYDINQESLDISDEDYGIWYLDALEHPKKYDGKKVSFLALVYRPQKIKKGTMIPGRFAMTCCEDDISFIGFKCKSDDAETIPHKSWIKITAKIRVEFVKEYKAKGPVLYAETMELTEQPEEDLIYFN